MKNFLKTLLKINLILLILFNFKTAYAKPYFTNKNIPFDIIDAPIDRASKEYRNEVNQILAIQSNIELKEIDLALEEKNFTYLTLMKRANIYVNPKTNPEFFKFLNRITDTSILITDQFKNHWQTTRPYQADSRIKMLISPSKNYAYPSGHTSGSYIYAHVLGLLYPKKYQKLKEIANDIAWHRVLIGMHFPHDIEGGKKLALVIVGSMLENKEFQQDLAIVKKKIRE